VDEVKEKSGNEIDVLSWKQEGVQNLPLQENGYFLIFHGFSA
jgi:sentrin-specific protease 1